jgi:hypothetical protein
MKHPASQSGMTMWGMLFVLGVLAFFLFLLFKLFPPYMTDFKVRSDLDGLARESDLSSMNRGEIAEALSKRFDIDAVDSVDLNSALSVDMRGRMKIVRIKYEVVVPMFHNISVLLDFDHEKQVAAGG